MPANHSSDDSSSLRAELEPTPRTTLWRIAGWLALTAVLALSFIGYLTPHMQVQWANFMSMCGF